MVFSRVLPDVASAIDKYRFEVLNAVHTGEINHAFRLIECFNAVIPDGNQVMRFKTRDAYDEWFKAEMDNEDTVYNEDDNPIPKADDVVFDFVHNEDLVSRISFEESCYKWTFEFLLKIEKNLTALRVNYQPQSGESAGD